MAKMSRVLGLLAFTGGGAILLCMGGLGWAGLEVLTLRSTQAYAVSVAFLKESPAVRAQLGDDPQINPLVWGTVDSRVDGSGTATLTHLVTSSAGPRLIKVELQKSQDVWAAVGAAGETDGAAFTVDAGPPIGQQVHDPTKSIEAVARGEEAYATSDFVLALAEFDQAVVLDPNNPAAWLGRGRSYGRRGDTERAVADLDEAAKLSPGSADIWEALAWARLHSGRDQEALAALNTLLELRPGDARGLSMRADAYSKLGNNALAKMDAAAACQLGDSFACNLVQRLP